MNTLSAGPNLSQDRKKRLRTKILIYPKFQIRLVLFNIATLGAALGIIWIQTYRTFSKIQNLGKDAGFPDDHAFFRFLDFHRDTLTSYLLFGLAIAVMASILLNLWISFKLAGPLYRLRKYFTSMADDGVTPGSLRFRKGDYLTDLAPIINRALDRARSRDTSDKS